MSKPVHTDFELGMNVVYKDGKGNNKAMVYEGETNDRKHIIHLKNSTKLNVANSHLVFIQQMDMGNIPSTPLDYCKEVGTGLTKEEAQRLSRP